MGRECFPPLSLHDNRNRWWWCPPDWRGHHLLLPYILIHFHADTITQPPQTHTPNYMTHPYYQSSDPHATTLLKYRYLTPHTHSEILQYTHTHTPHRHPGYIPIYTTHTAKTGAQSCVNTHTDTRKRRYTYSPYTYRNIHTRKHSDTHNIF